MLCSGLRWINTLPKGSVSFQSFAVLKILIVPGMISHSIKISETDNNFSKNVVYIRSAGESCQIVGVLYEIGYRNGICIDKTYYRHSNP